MPAIVNVAAVAQALNLTERRVQQLVKEGMPSAARGRYDIWACAQWYIRYLQQALERRATENDNPGPRNLTEEKKRLIRAQADTAELEFKRKMGELIPAHLVDDKFSTFASTVKQRMLAVPSRIASRLEGESRDSIRQLLYDDMRDQLNAVSQDITEKHSASGKPSKRRTRRSTRASNRPGRTKTRRRT